jgi:hypothetical protein
METLLIIQQLLEFQVGEVIAAVGNIVISHLDEFLCYVQNIICHTSLFPYVCILRSKIIFFTFWLQN